MATAQRQQSITPVVGGRESRLDDEFASTFSLQEKKKKKRKTNILEVK